MASGWHRQHLGCKTLPGERLHLVPTRGQVKLATDNWQLTTAFLLPSPYADGLYRAVRLAFAVAVDSCGTADHGQSRSRPNQNSVDAGSYAAHCPWHFQTQEWQRHQIGRAAGKPR